MKKVVSLLACLLLLLPLSAAAPAYGYGSTSRAVIGADLNEQQIAQIYKSFGVQRGTVTELKVTNAEERLYLQGYVDESVIGTRSISSVYVELLPSGSGMDVSTSNINWCSPQMYTNALTTAGITDARVIVASPFEVSGTAALTGVFKAYEDMTGHALNDRAKAVGTQELTITGQLAETIGSFDSTSIVNDLKMMLNVTASMSDEQLRQEIVRIAANYNVSLSDWQISQLISLCRAMESLDTGSLRSRVEKAQEALGKVSETKDEVVGFFGTLRRAAESVISFFDKLSALLG